MGEIAVILGRFGSGKTEFALNYAIKAADSGKKTVLADLDLVNPYFTSGLQAGLMERHNVKLIASIPTDEKVELPEDIYSVFSEDWDVSVLDAGGDPVVLRVPETGQGILRSKGRAGQGQGFQCDFHNVVSLLRTGSGQRG